MEKENKYYAIIESMVKNHKKFSGLESILDDIVSDVYKHAEAIIESVNNVDVITAYLERVVSTSIITVPKKMDFHKELKHRSITPEIDLKKEETTFMKVDTSLVDKMINSPDVSSKEIIPAESIEEPISISDEQEIEISEELSLEEIEENSYIEVLQENNMVDDVEELTFSEELNADDNAKELFESESVDTGLDDVEKSSSELEFVEDVVIDSEVEMLDEVEGLGIEETLKEVEVLDLEEKDVNAESEEFAIETLEEIQSFSDNILEGESETLDSEFNLEEDECIELDSQEELLEEQGLVDDGIEDVDTNGIVYDDLSKDIEELEPSELAIDADFDNSETLNVAESLELLDESDSLDLDSDLSLAEEASDIIFEQNQDEDLTLDTDSEDVFLEATTETTENIINQEIVSKSNAYLQFSFNPNDISLEVELEANLIVDNIEEMAKHKTDLKILSVYNLRYKEKLTVSEISEKLAITEDNVIEALNEIITVV